ncbi:MAG: SMI1/KNR4 family protein [Campylobacterota bacterium]|nr:SMI1/KNR4 family protein [Campylobacterota bacterium]
MYSDIYNIKANIEKSKPATNEIIEDTQKQLGIFFGKEYREFLKEFGCLSVEYLEFYGICGSNSSAPNMLYVTLKFREEMPSFSKELIVIYEVGEGSFYCVDKNDKIYLCNYDNCQRVDKTFREFLYEKVGELQ